MYLFGEVSGRGSVRRGNVRRGCVWSGKCPSGKCPSEMCLVGEMSVGEMSVGEVSVGTVSVGEMSIGEVSGHPPTHLHQIKSYCLSGTKNFLRRYTEIYRHLLSKYLKNAVLRLQEMAQCKCFF